MNNNNNNDNNDNTFTIIYFPGGLYHSYKSKLERISRSHNLILNKSKTVVLTSEDIYGTYTVFGHEEVIEHILTSGILKPGTSLIYENIKADEAIKIITFDNDNTIKSPYPHLIIYKGTEYSFYKEFISYCIGIGCTISKGCITKDGKFNEIFKKRKSDDESIFKFKRSEDNKDTMKELFLNRIEELKRVWKIDNSFVMKWQELIDKH